MNVTIDPSKSEYIELIRRYLNNEIDEVTFGAAFQELQRRYWVVHDEKISSWPERYDVQLQEAYSEGKISQDEFAKKWHELWGYKPDKWRDIVYADLLYLFDRRSENEEVLMDFQNDASEYNRTYFLTEEQLKEELKRYLKELESSNDK